MQQLEYDWLESILKIYEQGKCSQKIMLKTDTDQFVLCIKSVISFVRINSFKLEPNWF